MVRAHRHPDPQPEAGVDTRRSSTASLSTETTTSRTRLNRRPSSPLSARRKPDMAPRSRLRRRPGARQVDARSLDAALDETGPHARGVTPIRDIADRSHALRCLAPLLHDLADLYDARIPPGIALAGPTSSISGLSVGHRLEVEGTVDEWGAHGAHDAQSPPRHRRRELMPTPLDEPDPRLRSSPHPGTCGVIEASAPGLEVLVVVRRNPRAAPFTPCRGLRRCTARFRAVRLTERQGARQALPGLPASRSVLTFAAATQGEARTTSCKYPFTNVVAATASSRVKHVGGLAATAFSTWRIRNMRRCDADADRHVDVGGSLCPVSCQPGALWGVGRRRGPESRKPAPLPSAPARSNPGALPARSRPRPDSFRFLLSGSS